LLVLCTSNTVTLVTLQGIFKKYFLPGSSTRDFPVPLSHPNRGMTPLPVLITGPMVRQIVTELSIYGSIVY
jgi:hypothetical protein